MRRFESPQPTASALALMAPDSRSVMIGDTARPIPQRQALMKAVVEAVIANHRAPSPRNVRNNQLTVTGELFRSDPALRRAP
ncbi:hypothetical protein ABC974_21935 [Sphingomonas oligophenolica]|uniref:Uncharacterized protein n=1 Tax=Sphingomonas oligophenolica TaxID=301154 RepID=A0ABU9Y917_9SPHN